MGVTLTKKGIKIEIETSKDVLAKYQKQLGTSVGSYGGLPINSERVPTGFFPFDLATGGGLPRGRTTIIYGPEDSCKTSLVFRAIANHQKIWPDLTCVYVAIEPFDAIWSAKLGVNLDKLVVINPSFAEQAVDITRDFLMADDIGIVALDSLAAMITTQEAGKSAEGATPGGQGLVTGKLVRQTTLAMRESEKAGRYPTLIYINQTRFKIGVMYGNPETMPGGQAPKFQAALRVRVSGSKVTDSKVSDMYPVRRAVSFTMQKAKIPLVADNGKFEMVTFPHNGLNVGETDDIGTIQSYLESLDFWEKDKKGWKILGQVYPTQQAFKDRVYGDRDFGMEVRRGIIDQVLAQKETLIPPAPGGEIDADGVVTEDDDE